MEPHVELGEVEAEELDSPPQGRQPAGRDARATVSREAPGEHVEICQQLGRAVVAVVSEPPPDERKLAAVGLKLAPPANRSGVVRQLALVARDRLVQLR